MHFKESFCLNEDERWRWVHRLEKLGIMRNNNWMKLTGIKFDPRRPRKNDSDAVHQCVLELPKNTVRFNNIMGVNAGMWGQRALSQNTLWWR